MTHFKKAAAQADLDIGKAYPEPYRIFSTEHVVRDLDIYLSHEIVEPSAYDELCHTLRTATESDDIRLFINTVGGSVASGLALIQAMQESEATITTILNPEAYSMGALLYVAGDKHVISSKGILMFHNYSGGMYGKGNEQAAEIAAVSPWFEQIMREVCVPFLTDDEVTSVLKGGDLWLRQHEIIPRLNRLHEFRQAQAVESPQED
ncbi:ATP-dependent Clp protease, protease subunit [Novimethylophilus kurashikiensis]|uniref:ATP-dependent Clp protease proteolytic subunit n=1 Tax=Novimethylophilus kurashikiensis TaxID=1825523 RepID=A0A2R5F889_9PROT|nr:ATP-dependent Clp protease proteolytic subunit [Novimethylophilus kurashikiensis]GBG14436.1 ATP-dependent Clp protease, protease subunit [Novimethylophilus kurashikiensis]